MRYVKLIVWNIHIQWLAFRVRATIRWAQRSWIYNSSGASTLYLALIDGPISYISALHEIGHIVDPNKYVSGPSYMRRYSGLEKVTTLADWETILLSELEATSWAVCHALWYRVEMGRAMLFSFQSYVDHAPSRKGHLV